MGFLPIFLDLASGRVILAGSGPKAVAKLQLLRSVGADVHWFAPHSDVAEELLLAGHYAGHISVTIGEPGEADLAGALAVVAAGASDIGTSGLGTSDLGARVSARAQALGIPVNVVDRPDLSTFIFPAVVDRGDVMVSIGTGGSSPVLARRLRERIEAILPARIGDFAALMKRYRERLAQARAHAPLLSLRRFWERVID